MDAYAELIERIRRANILDSVQGQLEWDREVLMPEAASPLRAKQTGVVAALAHQLRVDPRVGELLASIDEGPLDEDQRANLREIRRKHIRRSRVPEALVQEYSEVTSEATVVWRTAHERSDFPLFAPHLKRVLALTREIAGMLDPELDPYEAILREYDPYADLEGYSAHLARIRAFLAELLPKAMAKQRDIPTEFLDARVPEDVQMRFLRDMLSHLGYDFSRGRLDTSPHPMSFFTSDSRITTRFDDGWEFAFMSTIHEMGHAFYELGCINEENFGMPLAEFRSYSVHESQSRLWEQYVATMPEFWEHFFPKLQKAYAPALDGIARADLVAALTRVQPSLIRVSADELTYPLHVILRFELERELFRGELEVDDLPRAWNAKMEELLGIPVPDDAHGVLQDVHWSAGNFGYFSTYLIGTALAAQILAAVERDVPGLRKGFSKGDFAPLREWLGERIHRHGSRYVTAELIERATGKAFGVEDYLAHLEEKYG